MAESFSKKEKPKKKIQQRQEKAEKMRERKATMQKGRPIEEMMAYLDENGNLSNTPPGTRPAKPAYENRSYNIKDTAALLFTGVVSFFNTAKGYGFINDSQNGKRVFVHSNNLLQPVQEGDEVMYHTRKTDKGWEAVQVRKKQ
ncbi:MAG: cold shock domain-containing protein [Bacteroidetes bacterium]|nr:cold shock domain-containing protein [Bacteroidota bacterium]